MPALAATLPVYLDHHATTPCEPRVVAAMVPHLSETYGNASSRSHAFGWAAEAAVEQARDQVAALLGCTPKEICFTSGATEADNLALFGVAAASGARGRHIVSVCTEHKAVLEPLEALRERGFEVTLLPVDADGLVSAAQIEAALRPDTRAGQRDGRQQRDRHARAPGRDRRALQGAGRALPFGRCAGRRPRAVGRRGARPGSGLAVGPQTVRPQGYRRAVRAASQPDGAPGAAELGGGHERGRRAGTLPVHQIVGFGVAARIAREEGAAEAVRLATLRDTLLERLRAELPDVRVNGSLAHRLPNNLNVSFPGVEGEALLMALRDFALSSGAACTSATLEPSHVLRALGVPSDLAHASLRFGLGRGNTLAHVEQVAAATIAAVRRLRALREPPPRRSGIFSP
jgi:cysteine desulfurase